MSFPAFRQAIALLGLLIVACCCPAIGQTYGLSQRPTVGPYYDGTFPTTTPAVATDWSAVVAFPNLTFSNPLGMLPVPGTNKLLVWEREGRVWSFDNDPAVSVKTLVLDISSQCQGWDDSGLLGLAIHPDFLNNHQIFIWYNWRGGLQDGIGDLGPILGDSVTLPPTDSDVRTRLSRFVLDPNAQTPLASEDVLIDQKKFTLWHNGGGIFFHPGNGFLYIGTGADTDSLSQQIDAVFISCLLRIDVDMRGGSISHPPLRRAYNEVAPDGYHYYIPNDNPFVGVPNALEEIYALGLRNPHRITHDAVTGRTFIGDVGGSIFEEIDIIEPTDPAGLNFQWDRLEGGGADIPDPVIGVNKQPYFSYNHSDGGTCIIGGYVYRGSQFPELVGKYIFGDNVTNNIWYLDDSTVPMKKVLLTTLSPGLGPTDSITYQGLSSFGIDGNGEIYMCQMSTLDGKIYKLQRGGAAPTTPLPATLSATGLFDDLSTLTPSNRLIPYEINLPFWSDHAIKTRFASIPSGTTVGFHSTGEWNFPAGSIFVKHFDYPSSDVDSSARHRLETRVIVKKDDGTVYGATYKWRADESDADLLDGSLTETLSIATGDLGAFTGDDVGGPDLAGATTRDGNIVTLTGGGTDIGGQSDQFQFAHQTRGGDFDVSVRVKSLTPIQASAKAGLMVRESLAPDSRYLMALVYPSNGQLPNNTGGYALQFRSDTGGNIDEVVPALPQPNVSYPDTWLRLKREGDTFVSYSSKDGATWMEYARKTIVFSSQIQFGFALTSAAPSSLATANFEVETRHQNWYYPSRQDCISCHNPQAGGVLGLTTRQLNGDTTYVDGTVANQIRSWNHVGLFSGGPSEGDIASLEKLYGPTDTTASLQTRARSYLDANCANCHRPGGAQAFFDARYQTPFELQGLNYGTVSNNLGHPDGRVIVPQDLDNSILYQRVSVVGANQMPPVGRNLVDADGVAMLAQWIQSLQPNILPDMSVLGNDVVIANNDFSPDLGNFTDFGAATPGTDTVTRTFVIKNSGNGPLNLTGSPHIAIQGSDASSFSVVQQPADSIASSATGSFQILFNPLTTGTKSAFITITSNDLNVGAMVFAVRGTATQHKLLAWWKLDETAGTTATDSSGNGCDGTLTTPLPTWTSGGRSEGTLRFTGVVNQSVTIQNDASLNPTAAITVAAWVNAIDWNGNHRVLQKGVTDNQYRLLAENGRLVWSIAGVGQVDIALPAVNTWFHVAGTYEGRTLRLYLNGVLVAAKTISGTIPVTADPLYLGAKVSTAIAGDHLNGYLDEVRIYANALTATEINALSRQSGAVSVDVSTASIQKGTATTGAFIVTRAGRTTSALPISLSVVSGDGQAVEGSDFTFSPALASLTIPAGETTASLTVTPGPGTKVTGPLYVTVSLAEGSTYTVGANPSARIQILDTALNQWKATAFGSIAAAQSPLADDLADADGDGMNTLMEAALGGNPLVNDSSLLPAAQVEFVDGDFYLTTTYTRITPPPAGMTLLSRTSSTLSPTDWQDAVMVTGYPIANSNGTETVKVRSSLPVLGNPQQFMRLELSKP
jgi:glucose/arabinose dehydrogenase/mono/diheme cytochrome c family protein